jgi:hypothetical protein
MPVAIYSLLAPGPVPPAPVQAEARVWLQDEQAIEDLLALAKIDAAPVLPRIRQRLAETAPRAPMPVGNRCRCRLCKRRAERQVCEAQPSLFT